MPLELGRRANLFFQTVMRPHAAERGRDLWFQEEARAERLSNFIRIVYILAWLISTALHAPGNHYWSNIANLGVGGLWFVYSVGLQTFLHYRPYRPWMKMMSTTLDMVVISTMIWMYQYTAGPSYALKVPTIYNYYCCIGLASLRFKKGLVIWAGGLASFLYLMLFLYFSLHYSLDFGSNIEHTNSSKINPAYIVYQLVYLAVFSFLTAIAAVNVKRLVELRAREAEAANRAQERAVVAAGVAHEIKNPLGSIYGAAQLLQDEGKGNPRFVSMILKDAGRLNETVQQFLRFARPFAVQWQTLDLVAFLRQYVNQHNEIFANAEVPSQGKSTSITGEQTIRTKLVFHTEVESLNVVSDEDGLKQIMLNLIQNAERYQIPGLPVRIELNSQSEVAEISVVDEGKGITDDEKAKLFEPFFTTSAKGTGLGLAISRKIAREMGGDLYYEALVPGSRFVVVVSLNQPKVTT